MTRNDQPVFSMEESSHLKPLSYEFQENPEIVIQYSKRKTQQRGGGNQKKTNKQTEENTHRNL